MDKLVCKEDCVILISDEKKGRQEIGFKAGDTVKDEKMCEYLKHDPHFEKTTSGNFTPAKSKKTSKKTEKE